MKYAVVNLPIVVIRVIYNIFNYNIITLYLYLFIRLEHVITNILIIYLTLFYSYLVNQQINNFIFLIDIILFI